MLKPGEIIKIKEKTEFDFDKNKWIVPSFYVRNKEVALPKIKNAHELVIQELYNRELFMGLENGINIVVESDQKWSN